VDRVGRRIHGQSDTKCQNMDGGVRPKEPDWNFSRGAHDSNVATKRGFRIVG